MVGKKVVYCDECKHLRVDGKKTDCKANKVARGNWFTAEYADASIINKDNSCQNYEK